MNADGSGRTRLATGDWLLDWSPDGQHIVFTRESNLYLINVDGSGEKPLTTTGVSHLFGWSPDGSRILFESDGGLFTINPDGSGLTRLVDELGEEPTIVWLADGARMAFTSDRDGAQDIYVVNLDGSGLRRLTDARGVPANPAFERTWARTDQPVSAGVTSRTWMWGPACCSVLRQGSDGGDA
jgi:Tol biopolymer transport system component